MPNFSIYLNDDEFERLKKRARALGLTHQEFVKRRIASDVAADEVVKKIDVLKEILDVVAIATGFNYGATKSIVEDNKDVAYQALKSEHDMKEIIKETTKKYEKTDFGGLA